MYKGIQLFAYKEGQKAFPFVGARRISYFLSALLVLASVYGLFGVGLNYGIDFKGGTLIEVRSPEVVDMSQLRQQLNQLDVGEVALQEYGEPQDLLIRLEQQSGGEEGQHAAVEQIKRQLGPEYEFRRVESVGPKVGKEMVQNGITAGILALVAMLMYVWFRFEWQFGICAILALAHDALLLLGFFAWSQLEFGLTAVVAILITIGYSINDTVVIYDRVRENLRHFKRMEAPALLDRSVHETISRTVLTSGSTLVALLALYMFGGEVIAGYSLPILVGVIVGTYSSIFLAAPLLVTFRISLRKTSEETPEPSFR